MKLSRSFEVQEGIMSEDRIRRVRRGLAWALTLAGVGLLSFFALHQAGGGSGLEGEIETSVRSDYSNIRVRRQNDVRTLSFIRDSGEEVVESMVDLKKPHDLLVTYTRYMFLSYLFRPKVERVLIVGLGGGSMIHFLKHYDPKVKVDVVDIDPAIVRLADKYFGVRTEGNVTIHTMDAFEYLKNTKEKYDIIYMDAFLKPSRDTDQTGVPLRLKTIRFYKDVQTKLTPDGLVVYNINPHPTVRDDVNNIRDAFGQTYVFNLPGYGGMVVIASLSTQRPGPIELLNRAGELDRRFPASYSYREMVRYLDR